MARRPPGRRAKARTPEPKPEEKKPSGRRTAIIASMALLVIIAVSVVIGLYFSVWQDLWSPVLKVNDETTNMDYLIRRMKYLDKTDDAIGMLTTLTEEEFIRQGATRYGIEVTPDEIDELIRDIARGENETISESEFKAWYRNALNEIKLSDAEYREWLGTILLADRLNAYFVERIPTVAEQVHLHIIVLSSPEDADAAKARIEEGEDFSELARELSIDEESAEQGGDIGWWPQGALEPNLGYVAFNVEIGQVSDLVLIDEEGQIYAICMITERQSARDVEEDKLEVLKDIIFQEWLYNEWNTVDYQWLGMDWNENEQRYIFGSKTIAWISLQLVK